MIGLESAPPAELELLFFEVGGRVYGADTADVLRIVACTADAPPHRLLGEPLKQTRALVIPQGLDESQVPVDRVLGTRRVPLDQLRRMPEFARGLVAPAAVGFVMDKDDLVPLIDLRALVKERGTR